MRFALASDVHLEFGPITLENTKGADVLILSGDICVAKDLLERDSYNIRGENDRSNKFHQFFEECCNNFPHVVYVMGNHEHYHGDFALTESTLRTHFSYLKNLHLLEKQTVKIGDVTFIGGTLWTDMNKEDPHTLYSIKGYMNDYRIIEDSAKTVHYRDNDGNYQTRTGKFSPERSVTEHKAMLKLIDDVCVGLPNEKIVVVGHHAPSKLSTKPKYQNDTMMNGAYSSDLSEFILDRPMIKVWTHGHTHDKFDYMIGSTRIVCNPRGYVDYEDSADNFELQYIEV